MQIFNFFYTYANFLPTFLRKNAPLITHSLIFAIKARGSQQVNESTSQQVNKLKSDRSDKRWV